MAKFALVDHDTNNILGEYPTMEQAEKLRDRLVEADERAAKDLKIHTIESADVDEPAVAFERAAG